MGEIADMMLDGTLCQGCGVYLDDGGPSGFPRYCGNCEHEQELNDTTRGALELAKESRNVSCKTCGKRVRRIGLDQHMRDKHGAPKPLAQALNDIEHEEQP